MITAAAGRPIPRHDRTRLIGGVFIFALLVFGFSSIFLSAEAVAGPCGPSFPELPTPTPTPPAHRVVQLVNCSNQTVLGAANAAGKVNAPLTSVLPREGTWVMQPQGSPNGADILTIDIPPEWEATIGAGATTPNIWVRTGCRYDIANNRAQCETGGCGGVYDCSKAKLGPSVGATLFESTFYEKVSNGTISYFKDSPDISAVNGANLNMGIQPVGGSPNDPFDSLPTSYDPQWLATNQPLTVVGGDLRANGACTLSNFQLKRSNLTGITQSQGRPLIYGFVIVGNDGTPLGGDSIVACFSNCGKYEWPLTPVGGAACSDSDPTCYNWKSFCLNAPAGTYGKRCTTDADCPYGLSCWDLHDPKSSLNHTCQGRAFIKNNTCSADVCTFPYGYVNPVTHQTSYAFQPPFGHCTNVTSDPTACIGDDTIHQVMPKAYTWPNDPQVYGSDAPLMRILFAPGGTTAPITPSTTPLPLCSTLPTVYGYANQYGGPLSGTKPCDIEVNKNGAKFAVARPATSLSGFPDSWSCNLNAGASGNDGVICSWH